MDANFAGVWSQGLGDDLNNVMSSTVMVIMYADYPVYWHISLKTEIAIVTAEAE